MDLYLTIKVAHIISSTVLFGTGLGIAFFMFRSHFSEHIQEKYYAALVFLQNLEHIEENNDDDGGNDANDGNRYHQFDEGEAGLSPVHREPPRNLFDWGLV